MADPDDTNLEGATVRISSGLQNPGRARVHEPERDHRDLRLRHGHADADRHGVEDRLPDGAPLDPVPQRQRQPRRFEDGRVPSQRRRRQLEHRRTRGIAVTARQRRADASTPPAATSPTTRATAWSTSTRGSPSAIPTRRRPPGRDGRDHVATSSRPRTSWRSPTSSGSPASYNDDDRRADADRHRVGCQLPGALRTVTYENSSDTPADADRTVTFQATDPTARDSNVATRDIDVGPANDAPVVTTSGGSHRLHRGRVGAATVDNALTVTDDDDTNLEGATVRISAASSPGTSLNFADQRRITGALRRRHGRLTLTGTASVADYQTALRSITFSHYGRQPARARRRSSSRRTTATCDSNVATKNIAITRGERRADDRRHDAALDYDEGDGARRRRQRADPDRPRLRPDHGRDVSIIGRLRVGRGRARLRDTRTASRGTYDSGTGILTLTGSVVGGQLPDGAALGDLREQLGHALDSRTRTVSFQANGYGSAWTLSNIATRDVTVSPTNDAPVVTTSAGAPPTTRTTRGHDDRRRG